MGAMTRCHHHKLRERAYLVPPPPLSVRLFVASLRLSESVCSLCVGDQQTRFPSLFFLFLIRCSLLVVPAPWCGTFVIHHWLAVRCVCVWRDVIG
ncbi:hypothetical protein BC567DRAFT_229576 [Phyllosticta citribraziliensis]